MWYNPLMIAILRSSLHGLLSANTLILTWTGRKSGKQYSTPVNYVRDGTQLWVTSTRERTWWRSLRGGAPVTITLAGRDLPATATAVTEPEDVARGLARYFEKAPQVARYFHVGLDANGKAVYADCLTAARERVVIRIDLKE
ncbi:MAG TPA: nitroreductase family deazaflavin-dependent oxidoreductase [Anaerolineaceae bacterium]|nr:nitroreductase family deazaflavin-dependent oxidoreductase [Anaerolineaceae bacterium]